MKFKFQQTSTFHNIKKKIAIFRKSACTCVCIHVYYTDITRVFNGNNSIFYTSYAVKIQKKNICNTCTRRTFKCDVIGEVSRKIKFFLILENLSSSKLPLVWTRNILSCTYLMLLSFLSSKKNMNIDDKFVDKSIYFYKMTASEKRMLIF